MSEVRVRFTTRAEREIRILRRVAAAAEDVLLESPMTAERLRTALEEYREFVSTPPRNRRAMDCEVQCAGCARTISRVPCASCGCMESYGLVTWEED